VNTLLIGLDRVAKRNASICRCITRSAKRTPTGTHDDLRRLLFAHGDHFTAGIDLMQWRQPSPREASRARREQ
jgi:hypothetical protein